MIFRTILKIPALPEASYFAEGFAIISTDLMLAPS
jgi:hypothetical protein